MKNFFIIKKIVENELSLEFYKLLNDESFKAVLKHGLKKQLNPVNVSAQLIGYIKEHYITLN